jgi:membrane-associated phospholipid phosphatase
MEGISAETVVVLSRGRRVLRAVLHAVLLSAPVFLLAAAVRLEFRPVLAADAAAIDWATELTRSWGLTAALLVVQAVGHPIVVYTAATLVAVWVGLVKRMRGRAIWAFATMMAAWIIGEVMKLIVQRGRPVVESPLAFPPGYSFPSGHALNITVAASVLLVLLWPLLSATGRAVAMVLAAIVVLLVGLDRVFLGVHYPSDVLAGCVLGCCITVSSWVGFVGPMGGTSSSASSAPR